MGIPLIDTVIKAATKVADKLWMDKDKAEELRLNRDQFEAQVRLALKKMEQDGELAQIEAEWRETEAQRQYAHNQFGTAEILKDFTLGKIILFGRASIRWVITGFAMWQTHRIVSQVLSDQMIQALAKAELSTTAIWLVALVVSITIGIPLFYVTGISVEKILKSRGVI